MLCALGARPLKPGRFDASGDAVVRAAAGGDPPVALRGSGVVVGDERLSLAADHLDCVDAGTSRTLTSGAGGLRVLCVGGVSDAAYAPPHRGFAD